jgi:molecular chaperone GrpE
MTEESKTPQEELTVASETPSPEELIKDLQEKLTAAERKAEENWDKFLRAQAELENLRRRMERELQNVQKYAIERFAKDLLAVADSLELGLRAATETEDLEKIREGIELTLKQLLTVFDRFNLHPIEPVGEKFNPEFHQAMAVEEVKGAEPETIVKVLQKGYALGDRLLRPALVVVAKPSADTHPRLDEQA